MDDLLRAPLFQAFRSTTGGGTRPNELLPSPILWPAPRRCSAPEADLPRPAADEGRAVLIIFESRRQCFSTLGGGSCCLGAFFVLRGRWSDKSEGPPGMHALGASGSSALPGGRLCAA